MENKFPKQAFVLLVAFLAILLLGCISPENPAPTCGNNSCETGETTATCPSDCPAPGPVCGDQVCNGQENNPNCPSDCPVPEPVCGNSTCEPRENSTTCPEDCGGCICPAIYAPVCGIDGKTYSSQCTADCAGITVSHTGECTTEPAPTPETKTNIAYGNDPAQKMDIFTDSDKKNAPLILLVHGGGWAEGDKEKMENYHAFFQNLGFVVAQSNYRLVSNGQNQYPIPVQDVACSLAYLKTHAVEFGADPHKVLILGHSAGSQIAGLIAYNPEGNWLSGCSILNADLSVAGFIGSGGVYDFDLVKDKTQVSNYLGNLYSPTKWDAAAPITYVNSGDPPALILTGDQDCFINSRDADGKCFANSTAFKNALDEARAYNQLVVIPGYNHNDSSTQFSRNQQITSAATEFVKKTVQN